MVHVRGRPHLSAPPQKVNNFVFMEGVVDCISCPVKRLGTFNINEVLEFELMYLHAREYTDTHRHTRACT